MTPAEAERLAMEVWRGRGIGADRKHIIDRIAAAILAANARGREEGRLAGLGEAAEVVRMQAESNEAKAEAFDAPGNEGVVRRRKAAAEVCRWLLAAIDRLRGERGMT
jgi:hypothetical protein